MSSLDEMIGGITPYASPIKRIELIEKIVRRLVEAGVAGVTSGNVDLSDYYTRNTINALLGEKADTTHLHDDRYFTESEINALLSGKSDVGHDHDDRYFTESEITALMDSKADVLHDHAFNGDRAVTSDVNGLNGVTPGGTTVEEFLENLFYPAVAEAISFNISPGNVRELGVNTTFTLSLGGSTNDGSVTGGSIDIVGGSQLATINAVGSDLSISQSVNHTSNGQSSPSYRATVNVTEGDSPVVLTRTPSFVDPFYYGVDSIGNITSLDGSTASRAQMVSDYTQSISSKSDKTYSFTPAAQRFVFAYPASYGALNRIVDPNGFDITSSFIQTTFTYTRADATTATYNLYYSDSDTTQNGFAITFDF